MIVDEVDVQRDYPPTTPNPKHEPGSPRGKSGTSVGVGSGTWGSNTSDFLYYV